MGIVTWFQENILSNTLMIVFLIAVIGYLVGSIKICGIELGTAGILLVALVFGHLGFQIWFENWGSSALLHLSVLLPDLSFSVTLS